MLSVATLPEVLILASQSPRRREILERAGIPFEVRIAGVPEEPAHGESPVDYVRRLSRQKAEAVGRAPGEIVLGADTVVVLDGTILEKPHDEADAVRMLKLLSGRDHQVVTGICIAHDGGVVSDFAETTVVFEPLSQGEIDRYVSSREPFDKAGAYGIQGLASKFVTRIEGCFFNVMGLPVTLVYKHLRAVGYA